MRKRGVHVVIDRKDLAAHFCDPAGSQGRAGAIAAVDGDPQGTLADCIHIEGSCQCRQVVIDGVSPFDHGPDEIPGWFLKFVLMVDVKQLGGLHSINPDYS